MILPPSHNDVKKVHINRRERKVGAKNAKL